MASRVAEGKAITPLTPTAFDYYTYAIRPGAKEAGPYMAVLSAFAYEGNQR